MFPKSAVGGPWTPRIRHEIVGDRGSEGYKYESESQTSCLFYIQPISSLKKKKKFHFLKGIMLLSDIIHAHTHEQTISAQRGSFLIGAQKIHCDSSSKRVFVFSFYYCCLFQVFIFFQRHLNIIVYYIFNIYIYCIF